MYIIGMNSSEIRKKFLQFFAKNGHTIVPSSSLIPDDPSVLLTTAGVQQFKPYYTGEANPMTAIHPNFGKPFGSKNVVSVQKCFRTSDIDEVGDDTHLTFFEMLGNFSFGGYFKEEAIRLAYEFITKEMNLKISYVTIFEGLDSIGVPEDKESQEIWKKLDPSIKIRKEEIEDVFWGPTGNSGPCGPTTEIYCTNANGQDVEIWNLVFNEFFFPGSREELLSGTSGKRLEKLKTPGVDTGAGLERLVMIAHNKKNIFETDLFAPLMHALPTLHGGWSARIASDHARGIVFLIGDGVMPSNKNHGYIVRRLIRRVIPHLKLQSLAIIQEGFAPPGHSTIKDLVEKVIEYYGRLDMYPYLLDKKQEIVRVIGEEQERFFNVYNKGNNILTKLINEAKDNQTFLIAGIDIFRLVTTYGFALEWIKDKAKLTGVDLDLSGFEREFKKHQEISRAGQEKKFGGHGLLLDTGELKAADEEELKIVTRLHTATHLLQAALRKVLGPEVTQEGSDITAERTRFDFTFSRKLTPEEIRKVEDFVNEAIRRDLRVEFQEMPYEEAIRTDALYFFKEKYPARVKVYSVRDPKTGEVFSREFCGGPHVTHTAEIGRFHITKEESSSAGVRRIRGKIV
ncbi:MAG: alanyl-tRNA synthetase [Parcubacteria group bacterium Gr01-1014_33]|nr:MAG: alanyl-tRNA synthetase [Parcubacteria group bacterium Gr01-1014_33]